jgi:hypothetical protein
MNKLTDILINGKILSQPWEMAAFTSLLRHPFEKN